MVVAAHGNFDGATCVETGLPVPIAECRDAIAAAIAPTDRFAMRGKNLVT